MALHIIEMLKEGFDASSEPMHLLEETRELIVRLQLGTIAPVFASVIALPKEGNIPALRVPEAALPDIRAKLNGQFREIERDGKGKMKVDANRTVLILLNRIRT